jgi:hypothetical protein
MHDVNIDVICANSPAANVNHNLSASELNGKYDEWDEWDYSGLYLKP